MNQAIVDVSVPWEAVITKLTPAVFAVTARADATATVPSAWEVKKIKELAVTAVVATVAVPPARATDPKLFATAAVVVPTLALRILLPDVTKFKFPVTLTFPDPALMFTAPVVAAPLPMTTLPEVKAAPMLIDPVVKLAPRLIVDPTAPLRASVAPEMTETLPELADPILTT